MIAAKLRMKCVVVPSQPGKEERWAAADLKLSSLQNFGMLHFKPFAIGFSSGPGSCITCSIASYVTTLVLQNIAEGWSF